MDLVYCVRCGSDRTRGDHAACDSALVLEPPRYCSSCRRRMVVQIVPTGWTAHCSEHGDSHGGNADRASPPGRGASSPGSPLGGSA